MCVVNDSFNSLMAKARRNKMANLGNQQVMGPAAVLHSNDMEDGNLARPAVVNN